MSDWAARGLVRPSLAVETPNGSVQMRYRVGELVALRVARELRQAGVSGQALREAVAHVPREPLAGPPLIERWLLISGDHAELLSFSLPDTETAAWIHEQLTGAATERGAVAPGRVWATYTKRIGPELARRLQGRGLSGEQIGELLGSALGAFMGLAVLSRRLRGTLLYPLGAVMVEVLEAVPREKPARRRRRRAACPTPAVDGGLHGRATALTSTEAGPVP